MKKAAFVLVLIVLVILSCKKDAKVFTDSGAFDYTTISAINNDSTINVIVEIPSGTTAKYEMDKNTNKIVLDSMNGVPRYITYLGYPGNYGMIPNTLLSKDEGGDGDPLDVMVLGDGVNSGVVIRAKAIAVLRLLDNGEQDDKIVAIPMQSHWSSINSIVELDERYPGVRTIIATFFENYKGAGEMKLLGWGDESDARSIINVAKDYASYQKVVQKEEIY